MEIVAAGPVDEALLLDLLNTTPVIEGMPHDELEDPATAQAWLNAHGLALTAGQLQELLDARAALQAVVRGDQDPQTLQPFLNGIILSPNMSDDGIDWILAARDASPATARVVLAWDALRISSPGRLRPCANSECRLFLIDRSKPNTARWCSMAICGNRMKARRHYQRSKTATNG
ncbi:CGNR zinc finger domain-containing protein [Mycolicibacter sp. MYC123]|uniref:CGNR zinc finger domain-containing protein n=1 Tax=[Mycobacterium] zoologicum TaxID=2872311 RepID=A0ABU5YKM5_9MYCO|nr:CGNR zinc finger domain-containing protein [Mycolicibacter sp. MYC123]MEB3050335.1 CGNR zinc finger domain-containing protein [Mycolicibacter sp. MYC123]